MGGQSLEVWGKLYNVPFPQGGDVFSTEDADWVGTRLDAKWLCDQLPDSELHFASIDDHTPSTAVAYIKRPGGRVLLMDFLSQVYGLDDSEVQRLAVEVALDGLTIKVLHPLLCLESRFANLTGIPSKRSTNGLAQARWAIQIVCAYLTALFDSEQAESRQIVRAIHRVAQVASSRFGRYCYLEFGLDPLASVPEWMPGAIGGLFNSRDWPNTQARIERNRRKWERHKARTQATDQQAPTTKPLGQ